MLAEPPQGPPYRQPLPQQPHQGKSLVRARSLADLSALVLLFELLLRLRELLGSVDSPSSSPDSGNESSFEDRLLPDLLLDCFSLLFRVFRDEWCLSWLSPGVSLSRLLLFFDKGCFCCSWTGPEGDRFSFSWVGGCGMVVAVAEGTMSSPGTLPFLKMPFTCLEVAMAARDKFPVVGAVDDDDCDVIVVIVGARGSSNTTDVLLATIALQEASILLCDASDVEESVLLDLWYLFGIEDFFSSRTLAAPFPCLAIMEPPAMWRPPLEVDELPADDGVL